MDLGFQELQSPSLRELFVKQMENMILSGKLPIGTKLPTERELSERMKVSRAVVNGGLADMEAKGFLQVIPRKGTYVANYKYKGKLDVLKSIMDYNGNEFDPDMLRSFLQARRDIEGSSVPLAAQHRTEEDLEILEDYLTVIESTDDVNEFSEYTFKFHHSICISSGNMIYPLIYYSFKPIICSLFLKYIYIMGKEKFIYYMKRILEYIRLQDPEKAKEIMLEEFDYSESFI